MNIILKKANYTEGVTLEASTTTIETETHSALKFYHYKNEFPLECGDILPELDIAYHTYGAINEAQDNVVWICHALTANSDAADWWDGMVGTGKLFDPAKYYIVCANMIGSHYGSTSPLSINPKTGKRYGFEFPVITVRDVAKAHGVLAQHLGIQRIKLAIGGSMGGQQVLEWAIQQPDLFEKIAVLACGAKMSPWAIALNESQRMAILADQSISPEALSHATTLDDFINAGAKGMEAARAIGMLSYRSYEGYNIAQNDPKDESRIEKYRVTTYQTYQGEKLRKRFNALSYLSLSKTMDSHNVGRNRGGLAEALKKIKADTLVVGIETDILFPFQEQVQIAAHVPHVKLETIDSKFGHDGFLIEFDQMQAVLRAFLSKQQLNFII